MTAERTATEVESRPKIDTLYIGRIEKNGELIVVEGASLTTTNKKDICRITLDPTTRPTPLCNFLANHITKKVSFTFFDRRASNDLSIVSLHIDIIEEDGKTISRDYEKFEYSFRD